MCLRNHKNIEVEMGEVTAFDLDAKRVTATRPDGRVVVHEYDSLIVSAGAGGSYFGHDEFAEFAPGMKTLADALDQRARIFGAFEMAELEEDPERRAEWLTFVVVGGGPTGVEIAGQIAELSRRTLKNNFRNFNPKDDVRVLLFDGGKEVLATFGDKLSEIGRKELEDTGVEVHTESIVTHVDGDHVEVKGPNGAVDRYAAKTKIWAAGVAASPLAKALADASRGRVRPQRPDQGAAGLLGARLPRGVCGRGHDELRGPARAWPRWRCSRVSTLPARSSGEWPTTPSRNRLSTATWAVWPPSRADGRS